MLPSYPQSKSTTIIPLEGSLDIGKKTTFKQELWAKTPEGVKKVVLDFGKVGFIGDLNIIMTRPVQQTLHGNILSTTPMAPCNHRRYFCYRTHMHIQFVGPPYHNHMR